MFLLTPVCKENWRVNYVFWQITGNTTKRHSSRNVAIDFTVSVFQITGIPVRYSYEIFSWVRVSWSLWSALVISIYSQECKGIYCILKYVQTNRSKFSTSSIDKYTRWFFNKQQNETHQKFKLIKNRSLLHMYYDKDQIAFFDPKYFRARNCITNWLCIYNLMTVLIDFCFL